jgi:hypothetical protein
MVVILVIIGLLIGGHFRAEHFEDTKQWAQEKAVLDYIKSKEDLKPVAFVLAKQIVDVTGDESNFQHVVLLAQDNKKDEIIQIVNNI